MPFKQLNSKRRWDFGNYKFHPLWDEEPSIDDPQAIVVGGEPLFRGTTSKFVDSKELRPHPTEPLKEKFSITPAPVPRIYMSEGKEDALGYGCSMAESEGGIPLVCAVSIDQELFSRLKPGLEGLGEWYVEGESIPRRLVKCEQITKKECEQGFPD